MLDVTFCINNVCNFRCEYCHWNKYKSYSFKDCKKTILNIYKLAKKKNEKEIWMYIHGGEASIHHYFYDLIKFIRETSKIFGLKLTFEIQTNLSMKKEVYENVNKYVDFWSVSFHYTELIRTKTMKRYLENLEIVKDKLYNLDIMLENVENIKKFHNFIINNILRYAEYAKYSEMIYNYARYSLPEGVRKQNEDFYNLYSKTKRQYKDGSTNDQFLNGKSFAGKNCSAGFKNLYFLGDGSFFRCANPLTEFLLDKEDSKKCLNINYNFDDVFQYTNSIRKCTFEKCDCGDFYIEKYY